MLRRLHHRLQLEIARIERRELRYAVCGQDLEGIGEIGQQIPGTERCNDAEWFTARTAIGQQHSPLSPGS
jgi:hypothetical protein